ncbi:restriction endonuclease [Micromonospora sp. NPDC047187]|uniref:restriction endonuclease n=1 Tax=Micromonospora sp. NPDC047187 TaxID=3155262 RepID=UPI0033DA6D6F
MKINMDGTVRPLKFNDKVLNKTFGAVVARLSDDDAQAIVFRHAELEVAMKVRQRWLAQVKSIAGSSASNDEWSESISKYSGWASVADEALSYIRDDQDQLDKEDLLARAHVLLCDKVIAALMGPSTDASLANRHGVGGACRGSLLSHLSPAAAIRADRRVKATDAAWASVRDGLVVEATARNSFAGTPGSVTLSQIDSCSPDSFEEQTAHLLERDGCRILRRRGGSNDQGADVIGVTPNGLRVVLQCKYSTKVRHTVDPRYFHELNGTARQEHGADIVGLVTNRTASSAAQEFATKHRIYLINRPVLERWATYGVSWLPSDNRAAAGA